MGIAVPRPAMRAQGRRFLERRLARHAELMKQFVAEGMSRDDASRKAYDIVKSEKFTGRK